MKRHSFLRSMMLTAAMAACLAVPARAEDVTQDILSLPNTEDSAIPAATRPAAPVITPKAEAEAAPAEPTKAEDTPPPPAMTEAPEKATPEAPASEDVAATPATSPDTATPPPPPAPLPEADVKAPAEPKTVTSQPAGPSLLEILKSAYADSPILRAGRESLRQQYENVAQADAYKRPSLSVSSGVTAQYADSDPGGDGGFTSTDASLSGTQYLYRGGRTLAEVDRQLNLSKAAASAYDSLVQTTMLNVLSAAMDIQRDRATITLTEKNLEVLKRQLSAAQKGFEVGSLTRTDVAQAQARVSGGEASLATVNATYAKDLARFKQYAGTDGDKLMIDMGAVMVDLPASLSAAVAQAKADHPDVRAAQAQAEAAASGIKAAKGELLPTLSLSGEVSQAWDPSLILDESRGASLGVRATMPIYDGGASRSAIRQARMSQYEKQNLVLEAQRSVEAAVEAAWNDYTAGQTAISAYKAQVDAAQQARDGVYKEHEVGLRTVIDTLDSDAELLDAQVGLVRAQHDEVIAVLNLLSSIGGLTADKLGIIEPVTGSTSINQTREDMFGTDAAPLK